MGLNIVGPTVRVLARKQQVVDVTNTTAETELFSYLLRGVSGPHFGVLGTGGILRLTMLATYLNNSGLPLVTPHAFRLKLGASTLITDLGPLIPSLASTRSVRIDAMLANFGLTNSQVVSWLAATSGLSAAASPASNIGAIDTTTDQTLSVTFQHGQAGSSITFRHILTVLERL